MIRETAREYLEGECTTGAGAAMEKDPLGYPPEMWKKVAELGWQGMCCPRVRGGSAMPLVSWGW